MVPELKPKSEEILHHLQVITARWAELGQPCALELVFLSAEDRAQVKNVAHFPVTPEGLAEAADHAEGMNRHGINAYAVINPLDATALPQPGKRAAREHILASFFHWADADTAEAANNIRNFVGPKCTYFVLTGTQPCQRPHVYWELEEPTRNLDAWERTQKAIAATLRTDSSVTDPPRIMRLAGTINWPKPQKREKGYIAEVTTLRVYDEDERPRISSERMARAFSVPERATTPQAGLSIDTGTMPTLDRERATIQAMSGMEWHNAVIRLVASYVAKGLSDAEIHALTAPLTLPGYTTDETAREVQTAIDGARRKGWTPEQQYADPSAITTPEPTAQSFDAPKRPAALEWFDDVEPSLTDAYLIKGVLSDGAMSVIYGPSNSGKTFFALDMAYCVAIGAPWHGRRTNQCAVLYLAAEGGRGVLNRITALKRAHGVCDVPMAVKRAGLDLLHDQADLQHIVDLAAEVASARPGPLLIIIDTLSRIMAGGDENSAADMTALIRNIDAIREATGAHIMLVHHTGKDAARGARGHSSLRAATDTEIEVANDNGARAAMVTKQRDYQGGETFAFTLKSVPLGFDQDGEEVTSCIVETQDGEEYLAARKARKGLGGNQKIVADTFDQLLAEDYGKPNPGGIGFPEPGRFMTVRMDDLRSHSMGKMAASNKRGAFAEAWKALSGERGLFCMASDLVWRTDRRIN